MKTEIEWVPVKDKLPDFEKNVLLFHPGSIISHPVAIGYLERVCKIGPLFNVFGYARSTPDQGFKATHWAEIPTPPTE
jgi:hypothetical protein